MSLRPEWEHLDAQVAAGAAWLLTAEQPPGALLQHHGLGAEAGGGLRVTFAPNGRLGGRSADRDIGRDAVIIVELHCPIDTSALSWGEASKVHDEFRPPPFTQDEIDSIEVVLTRHGLPVHDRWNGAGLDTGSFAVAAGRVHPDVNRLVATYHQGCPVHNSPLCGWDDGCDWYARGHELVVPPQFIEVSMPQPAMPSEAKSDDGLERVLAAIARHVEAMGELGFHPATIRPGALGDAEDGQFVERSGYGVALPPEVYDELVRRARLLDELGGAP